MPSLLYFVNVVSDAGGLTVVRGADFLSAFDKPQRDALAMLLLRLHDHQNTAAEILWGGWLFPLGILVYRSRFLPRFLGVWLVINGFAYVIMSFTRISVAAMPRHGVPRRPACAVWGAGSHVVARNQGREAASAGHSNIVSGSRSAS